LAQVRYVNLGSAAGDRRLIWIWTVALDLNEFPGPAAERPCVEQFLARARGGDALGTLAQLLRVASFARDERETRVLRQLDAFVRGLGARVASS
jgi:hypothetical protein